MGKYKVANGQINKGFAQGVICWMNGDNLVWAKYVVYNDKYAIELRETKVAKFGLATGIGWCLWGETISTTSNLQLCEGWI